MIDCGNEIILKYFFDRIISLWFDLIPDMKKEVLFVFGILIWMSSVRSVFCSRGRFWQMCPIWFFYANDHLLMLQYDKCARCRIIEMNIYNADSLKSIEIPTYLFVHFQFKEKNHFFALHWRENRDLIDTECCSSSKKTTARL